MKLSKFNEPPPPNDQTRFGKIESSLVRKPVYGVYPWWPEQGTDWIHPNDVELASRLIPSRRIFLRTDLNAEFSLLGYADYSIRIKPTMWLVVPEPDYEVADQVEVQSNMGKTTPKIATVSEVLWDRHNRKVDYHLSRLGKPVPGVFHADQLQPTVRLGETLSARQLLKQKNLSLSRGNH